MENYKILGLTPNASIDAIKKAYKALAKKYHTDNQETGNEEKFKEISVAYKEIIKHKSDNTKINSEENNNYSQKNEQNYYFQKKKLNKQWQTANKEKDKYSNELRNTEFDINYYKNHINKFRQYIILYLKKVIYSTEYHFSHQIGLNNASMINRIFDKRRLANQTKILE